MDLYSSMRLVSDGTLQTVLLSFEYTSRDEVHVYIDGLEKTTGWSWTDSTGKTIQFDEPVLADSIVLFRRLTKLNEVPYIFGEAAGSRGYSEFSAYTVDFNFDFVLRASQDALDSFTLSGATAEAAEMWAKRSEQSALRSDASANAAAASASRADQRALEAGNSATDSAASASASAASATEAMGYRDTAGTHASTAGTKAGEAAASAAASATSATNSANSAAASQTSRLASETARNQSQSSATSAGNSAAAALASQNAAAGSASSASSSATAAQTARSGAETARTGAQASETKAKAWADNDHNVPVEAGKFSAKHWAQVAQNIGDLNLYLKKAEVGSAAYANVVVDDYDTTSGRVIKTSNRFNNGWLALNNNTEGGRWAKIAEVTGSANDRATILIAGGGQGYNQNVDTAHSAILSLAWRNPSDNELQLQLTAFSVRPSQMNLGVIGLATVKVAAGRYELWLRSSSYTRIFCSSFGGLTIKPALGVLQVDPPAGMNDWSTSIHSAYTTGNLLPATNSTDVSANRFIPANLGWMGLGGYGINYSSGEHTIGRGEFFRDIRSTGNPYATQVAGVSFAGISNPANTFQLAGSLSHNRVFGRRSNNGVWQPPFELLTTTNILTTTGTSTTLPMSQKAVTDQLALRALKTELGTAAFKNIVGDVTVGHLMQTGEGHGGRWWRFANGLQICARYYALDGGGEGVNHGWPAEFIAKPYAWGTADSLTISAVNIINVTTSSFSYISSATSGGAYILGIGLWKLT